MTRRGASRLVAVVVAVAVITVLIPGTPVYLPNLVVREEGFYDGHSTGYWIKNLNSSDNEARYQAIYALGAIGPEAPEAVPALATIMLEDPDREARHQAAFALSKMDPASREAVPALAQALADEEPFVRVNAAIALFRLRGESRPAVPALIKALKDERNQRPVGRFLFTIQEMVALALGRASAGSDEGVPALSAALETAPTEETRVVAVRALGEIGAEAKPAAPALQALLKHKNIQVRQAAQEALKKIQGEPAEKREPPTTGAAGPLRVQP